MLAEQRQQVILEQLARTGAVAISDVVAEFGVSRETVRRDLNALAARGLLALTHGGALAVNRPEPDAATRATVNLAGKRAIGLRAAALVSDGASVILDSGTTTRAVAQALTERHNLTVYTNDFDIALLLARRHNNRLILLGGELQDHEDATQGWDTVEQLSRYRADFAFVGAGAITNDAQLTDYSRPAAELRGRMLLAANTPVVVADHGKFGEATAVAVSNFEKARYVVTDAAPEKALVKRLKALGPVVVIATD